MTWWGIVWNTNIFYVIFSEGAYVAAYRSDISILGRMIKSNAIGTRGMKCRIVIDKSSIQQRISFHQQIGLTFKEETSKVLHLEQSCVRCWNWTPRKIDQKYLESFVMWCWRRMGNISWIDCVRNEHVLRRIKEERNILNAKYNKNKEG